MSFASSENKLKPSPDFNQEQMEIKRKTEIFVSTRKRFVIHYPESSEQIFCPQCETATPMIAAEGCAALFGISRRAVYRQIEAGTAHFAETGAGVVMLCLPSLAGISVDDNTKLLPGATAEEI